ncbi:MAG: hypothetical protein RLZZ157_1148 [Pseudomonadota bacterium]|jgi:agmatine deiminase
MTELLIPAEWAPHKALWTCWPSDGDLWLDNLAPARAEVAAMVAALVREGPDGALGDTVHVLAAGQAACDSAKAHLPACVHIHNVPFGDIWLRDTGPIFATGPQGKRAIRFAFNGWGGKYELDGDDSVGDAVAALAQVPVTRADFVLEGGAVEHDGVGTILTTRQCVLNPNRNVTWTMDEAERHFAQALGARKVLWLQDGLRNDHTDGHIDNIARFVGPARVMIMEAFGTDDPNAEVYAAIVTDLATMSDAQGRPLEIIKIPSPGLVTNEDGDVVPASHLNFIIGNASVVVPHYGTASADAALRAIAQAFPSRRVVGVNSTALLSGGGSFHCITQQEPA